MAKRDREKTLADAFAEADAADKKKSVAMPGSGNPALPWVSLVLAIVGWVFGMFVSWFVSVLAGIAGIVVGVIARKKASPRQRMNTIALVLNILCVASSLFLVFFYLYKLWSLGVL